MKEHKYNIFISNELDLICDFVFDKNNPNTKYILFTRKSNDKQNENINNVCRIDIKEPKYLPKQSEDEQLFTLSDKEIKYFLNIINNPEPIVDNNDYGKIIKMVNKWSESIDSLNYEIFWELGYQLDPNLHYNAYLFASNTLENKVLPEPYLPIDLPIPNYENLNDI